MLGSVSVYILLCVAVAVLMLGLPRVLGERHNERATSQPYEAGAPPTGSAHTRMAAQYYVYALLFLIFDLEAVFLFAYAVSARQLGLSGLVAAATFIGVLLLAVFYLWRAGALEMAGPLRRYARRQTRARATASAREEPS